MDATALEPLSIKAFLLLLLPVYLLGRMIYALAFDKLRHIPGPKLNAVSRIPYVRHLIRGTTVENVVALHRKYGSVVRVSPNEISFTSADTAWPDIYGFRTGEGPPQYAERSSLVSGASQWSPFNLDRQ